VSPKSMHVVIPAIRAAPLVLLARGPCLGGFMPHATLSATGSAAIGISLISVEGLYSREPPILCLSRGKKGG